MKVKPLYTSGKETLFISLFVLILFFIIYSFYMSNRKHHTINLVLAIILTFIEVLIFLLIVILEIKYTKTRKVKKYGTRIMGKIIKLTDLSRKGRLSAYISYEFMYDNQKYIVENESISYSYFNTFKQQIDKGIDDIELIVYKKNALIKIKEY